MSRDHIESGLGWKYTVPAIRAEIKDSDTNVVVARAKSKLAGFAIMRYQGFEAHLVLFAVSPQYRRQGIGRRLIDWLIATARVAGAQSVFVELRVGNRSAKSFYRALGFVPMEELDSYYRGIEDGIRMALDLRVPGNLDQNDGHVEK